MAIEQNLRDLRINQLQHFEKELESVEAIKDHNFNRAKSLKRQPINYKREYDRLVGELSKTNITNNAKRKMENQ